MESAIINHPQRSGNKLLDALCDHYKIPKIMMQQEFKTEDQLQAYCVKWFNNEYPKFRRLLFHIPNGGFRNKIEAAKFKSMGVQEGVADLCLVMGKGKVIWLEAKLPTGSQSEAQIIWEQKVVALDHLYIVFYSFVEFQNIIWQIIGKS